MLTKTKNKEKNDFNKNHSFPIPENIRKIINERGFYSYEWIGEQDVKQSIERDFLKIIKKNGTIFSLILIIPSIIFYTISNYFLLYFYFIGVLFLINFILIIYLIFIAIKRSSILRKNSHILITDTSVSINGKIRQLENNFIVSNTNLDKIGELFEEELFKESNIYKTKKGFSKQVIEQIGAGYKKIMRMGSSRNRNSLQLVIIGLVLYSVYALSLGLIYLFGIFFIWIFLIFLSFINKQILLKVGHEITIINNSFENIDSDSKKLVKYGKEVSILLEKAMKNDIKDGLFNEINSNIEYIEAYASSAINMSIKLKTQIKESKYKDMFNFGIYNSWIKRQIYEPILEIKNLLEKNLNILEKSKEDIKKQINDTGKESFKATLKLQETRIISQISSISMNIKMLNSYLKKLI